MKKPHHQPRPKLSVEDATKAWDQLFVSPSTTSKQTNRPERPPHKKITHLYSVREHWGGPRHVVTVETNTISMLEAEINVGRVLREHRYIEEVLVDVIIS